jgi:hypothetical protein
MAIEKARRNRAIYRKSKLGGGTKSYRQLQEIHGFRSVKTVFRIVQREHLRK